MLVLVLLLIETCLLYIAYNVMGRDVLRPSVLLISMFVVSTLVCCLNISNWNINYLPETVLILTLGFLSAIVADYIGYSRVPSAGAITSAPIVAAPVKTSFVLAAVLLQLVVLYLYYQEIVRLALLDGYVDGANLLWHFRNVTSYEAEESVSGTVSFLLKVSTAVGYCYAYLLIKDLVSGKAKASWMLFKAIPVALFAIQVLMGSGRLELLRLVAFCIICSYCLMGYKTGWRENLSPRYVRKALALLPIVFVLFYLATNLIGRETSRSFFDYICTYAGGSIQHFNQYIADPNSVSESHFGAETFPGVYSLLERLGIVDYTRSVHLEMRQLGVTQGNIYTFFRRPYHDFGLVGMCLMTFVVVGGFSWAYSRLKARRFSQRTEMGLVLYAYLAYWVVLASIENYSIGIVSIGSVFTIVAIACVFLLLSRYGMVDTHAAPQGVSRIPGSVAIDGL